MSRESTDLAHRRLRAAILDGELAPGDAVSQVRLAEQLGISRTPLREAVRLLEREGLVESEPNRRVRVAPVSVDDLDALYGERIVLETLAVRLTVPRLDADELTALQARLARMETAGLARDVAGAAAPHRAFHHGLIAHAGARIVRLCDELWDHAERYRTLYVRAADDVLAAMLLAHAEHVAIFSAARDGAEEEAAALLARHYARTALTLVAQIAPAHDPAAIRAALRLAGDAAAADARPRERTA